jgi:Protein of unknown function (DUF551)
MTLWHKVSDKLPEAKVNVIIYHPKKLLIIASLVYNKGCDKYIYGDYSWYVNHNDYEALRIDEVSYWHELPKVPE